MRAIPGTITAYPGTLRVRLAYLSPGPDAATWTKPGPAATIPERPIEMVGSTNGGSVWHVSVASYKPPTDGEVIYHLTACGDSFRQIYRDQSKTTTIRGFERGIRYGSHFASAYICQECEEVMEAEHMSYLDEERNPDQR